MGQYTCKAKAYPAIILTPICEIVSKNTEHITVAQIIPATFIHDEICLKAELSDNQIAGVEAVPGKRRDHIEREFEKYVKSQIYRYHFLPKCADAFDHSFIDFQIVESFKADTFGFKQVGLVMSPWRESIPARYAAYCLRIGVPAYSKEVGSEIYRSISRLK